MNLNDYRIQTSPFTDAIEILYLPDWETLLTTQDVGLDTLLRVALEHDLKRKVK